MTLIECNHLEVILKTVERCNLNCSYCYFFQGGDNTYKKNPPFISRDTLKATADFLAQGCRDLSLKRINLNLHGGEPMMQKIEDFDDMCSLFRNTLDPLTELHLNLQTNGTLITDEWIELFGKHLVKIGVSCDGPADYHDKFRVDHKGLGSHAKVVDGIRQLNNAMTKGIIKSLGVLCVIDPTRDPKKIYNFFRKDLQINLLDFLLPDMTHDSFTGNPEVYGRFLGELFDVWAEEDNPKVFVRILAKALKHLTMNNAYYDQLKAVSAGYREFTIASSGKLGSIDIFRTASPQWMWADDNVRSISLADYLHTPLMENLQNALHMLPKACEQCCWKKICSGGYIAHRYAKENAFDNPTIYCQSMKLFYSHIAKYLLAHNYPMMELEHFLCSA